MEEDKQTQETALTADPTIQTRLLEIRKASFTSNNNGGCNSIIVHGGSSSNDDDDDDDDDERYPPGYRFRPTDRELISYYLKKRINNEELPRVRIHEVDLYKENPENLPVKYKSNDDEHAWYFLTPRQRKYRNGTRPDRAARGGYWKATGKDKSIDVVGFKKTLVFYHGKPPVGTKSDWIMQEFRVKDPPECQRSEENPMRLDNWVLCKVYRKPSSTNTTGNQNEDVKLSTQEIYSNTNVETNSVTVQPLASMPSSNPMVHHSGFNENEMMYEEGYQSNSGYFNMIPSDNNYEFSYHLPNMHSFHSNDQAMEASSLFNYSNQVQHINAPSSLSSLGHGQYHSMQNNMGAKDMGLNEHPKAEPKEEIGNFTFESDFNIDQYFPSSENAPSLISICPTPPSPDLGSITD